ncbi:MAG: zinc ribbon domain-containing protein [Candidatus Micrarchaeota archaeon]
MDILDGVMDTILRRTKDNLTYKAGDVATGAITTGMQKGMNAVKKEKGAAKPLENCPKCKAKLEPDAKFCAECGFRIIVKCEKCNIEYPMGTKFCKQCGEALK